MDEKPHVDLFTDGACSGNPGPGGWGVIMRCNGQEKELSGGEPHTTNNRMELLAAIEGLSALKEPCLVTVHADSQYVVKGMSEWLMGWLRRGWKNSQGKRVENQDLWERLHEVAARHQVNWRWVKGHAGHTENERADVLAVAALQKFKT